MKPRFRFILTTLALAIALQAISAAQVFHYRQGGSVEEAAFLPGNEIGVIVEDGGRIRRTVDQAQTWDVTNVPDGVRGYLRGIFFGSPPGFVGHGSGGLRAMPEQQRKIMALSAR